MRNVLLRPAALLLPLILVACSEVTAPGPWLDGAGAGGLLSGECTKQSDGSYLCPPVTNDPVYPADPCEEMESTGAGELESTTQSCPGDDDGGGSTAAPPGGETGGDEPIDGGGGTSPPPGCNPSTVSPTSVTVTSECDGEEEEYSDICPQPILGKVATALVNVAGRNHEFKFEGTFWRVNPLVGRSPAWYKIDQPALSKDSWWMAESGNLLLVCWGRYMVVGGRRLWGGTVYVQDTELHMVMGPGHPDF